MVENLDSVIEDLFKVVSSKKTADPAKSYTAQLFEGGVPKITNKVGEEAFETVVAALTQPEKVVNESADLLYHLLVLWAELKITPKDIFCELQSRSGVSGIDEKRSRNKQAGG